MARRRGERVRLDRGSDMGFGSFLEEEAFDEEGERGPKRRGFPGIREKPGPMSDRGLLPREASMWMFAVFARGRFPGSRVNVASPAFP
jgi:hypothetical protein